MNDQTTKATHETQAQEMQAVSQAASPVAQEVAQGSASPSRQERSEGKNENKNEGRTLAISAEKLFGELAPLVRVLTRATGVLDEETRLVLSRSPLTALRAVAQEKEALLAQHDQQVLRLQKKSGDLAAFVASLEKGVRLRLREVYARFEEALRKNGVRLKAALASSEMLLSALSEAAQSDGVKGPQLYTPQGRLSETSSVSLSRSMHEQREV